ncbi:MAG: CHAT domain-containing protein [Candidatus Aminicenantes bacterium]|nr:CHAT domain-containing protein [Candidatus Aminicenantes bacterium]
MKIFSLVFLTVNFVFQPNFVFWANDNSKLLSSFEESKAAGERFLEEGNYLKAFEQYEVAFKLSQGLKDSREEVNILMRLGLVNWNLGRMEVSFSFYNRAREYAQSHGQKYIRKECEIALKIYQLYIKGKNCRISGQFDQSIKYYEEAIRLSRIIKSVNHEVKCLRQMSLNYWEMSKIDEYFRLTERGQKLAQKINNRREEGISYNNVGLYYWKKNEFSTALKYFQISLEIAEKENQPVNSSDCLTNISLVYSDLGDYDKALDYLNRGILIDQELNNDYNLTTDLNNMGNVYLNKGIITKNDNYYKCALENFYNSLILAQRIQNKKVQSIVQNNIGEVFYAQNQYDQALIYYKKALLNANDSGFIELVSMLYNNIANLYLKQDLYMKAINYYGKSIDIAAKINCERILWESSFGLAQCYEKNKEYFQAIEYYKNAIGIIEKTRSQINLDTFKARYVRNKSKVYESFINLVYKIKEKSKYETLEENMFYYIERAKARAFIEILLESKIDIGNKLGLAQRKELDDVSEKISSLYMEIMRNDRKAKNRKKLENKLSQEEDNYLRIISNIKTRDPTIASIVSSEPYSLSNLQKNGLDNHTAIFEYFIGEQTSFLLFITRTRCKIFTLPSRQEIEASIKAYIKYISSPPHLNIDGNFAAKRIFRELLFPLNEKLQDEIRKLVIIPDGILYYLPYETLVMTESKNSFEYLINKYQVSYMPSVSALMLIQTKNEENGGFKGLLAFGDPIFQFKKKMSSVNKSLDKILPETYITQGFAFSSLPYSKKEVNIISKYFSKDRRFIYLGKDANKDNLKAKSNDNYQIIHFACHSFLDEQQPIRSALILSQDFVGLNDGILQVREIYNMKLNANMVVLSACQTGKGALEKGEGFLGLQRVFFYSGARSVLSTLWSVNDKSTSFFMGKYYGYLAEGYSKASALRLTKQKMINSKYSHPYYWASFVLNGEPDSKIIFH